MIETVYRFSLFLKLVRLAEAQLPILTDEGYLTQETASSMARGLGRVKTLAGQEYIHTEEEIAELNAKAGIVVDFLSLHMNHLAGPTVATFDGLLAELKTPGIPGSKRRETALQRGGAK